MGVIRYKSTDKAAREIESLLQEIESAYIAYPLQEAS